MLEPLPFLGRVPEPDDFLLYPQEANRWWTHPGRLP
jgi:hypothetical protein